MSGSYDPQAPDEPEDSFLTLPAADILQRIVFTIANGCQGIS